MKKISFTLLALVAMFSASAQHRSAFDDLTLNSNSYWNGSSRSGGFLDGDAYFTNSYDTTYSSWSGFAYSNVKINPDTIHTAANDYSFQYSSVTGNGANGSNAYGLSYTGNGDAVIRLKGFATGHQVYGMQVTNTTYDYLSMKYGDGFAKKFGGTNGTDPDWFRLTISGWYQGAVVANSVDVYLADFRSADTAQHYILRNWQFINLLPLGNVDSLFFTLNSSDTGAFGMNTPAMFALDNLLTTDGVPYGAPIAVNDSFGLLYIDTLTGNRDTLHANILANDSISVPAGETATLLSGPMISGATAWLDSNYNLVYVPAIGVQGFDTLTYSLCDALGSCDTADIIVFVEGYHYTGISDIDMPDLHMYPNPALSQLSVSYSALIESVTVVDLSGRTVMTKDINKNTASLNIETLSPGVYTVMIRTQDGTAVKRFVKE
jgi:hypothetical protein